jgi:hypothetical protein
MLKFRRFSELVVSIVAIFPVGWIIEDEFLFKMPVHADFITFVVILREKRIGT